MNSLRRSPSRASVCLCHVQGGMGVGVSCTRSPARSPWRGARILSSACLDRPSRSAPGRRRPPTMLSTRRSAREGCGGLRRHQHHGRLQRDYEASVRGAIDAGPTRSSPGRLPLSLPRSEAGDTALIPIVSSARALELICRRWERQGQRPDAIVLEGRSPAGTSGSADRSTCREHLEALLPPVKAAAIARGTSRSRRGRHLHAEDIKRFMAMGADGVRWERFSPRGEQRHRGVQAGGGRGDRRRHPRRSRPGSPCGLPFA